MINAVEIAGLRKAYGKTVALDGLDLTVGAGEMHGFLGPNGAGKTTTLRILLGLLRADGGRAKLLGGDPWHDAIALHRRIGYVPGDVTLWPNLTGGEIIDLLGGLHGKADPRRKDELIQVFELDPTKRARAYSKGNRQKVALVAALATDAELYILDEPTSGLDPLMEAAFRHSITAAHKRGRTVLLSSHILSEVEALCDRVTIIRSGKAVESGTLADLRHLTRTSVIADLVASPAELGKIPGVHHLVVEESPGKGSRVRCEVDADNLNEVLQRLTAVGVRSLVSQPPTLEELFLRHYGKNGAPTLASTAASSRPQEM